MENCTKRKHEDESHDSFSKRLKEESIGFDIFKDKFSSQTMEALSEMGFKTTTKIQLFAIPPIMLNHDVIGIAKTGSGKTLAFLIPVVEKLSKQKFKLKNALGAIILTPTRELAIQIQNVLKDLIKRHDLTFGIAIGGKKLGKEATILSEGVNILIATPGRLLYHLTNTKDMKIKRVRLLVIDEVDRMLDSGFEKDMKKILTILNENKNKNRQTLMFSATKNERVSEIQELALGNDPVIIDVDAEEKDATNSYLRQFYAICPTRKRFMYLHYFLMKFKKKKVIVFFDTAAEVEFFYNFYQLFESKLNITQLHGQKKQSARTNTFLEFCKADVGTLFCTDVAARGLDIPEVDCILQFDAPKTYKDYIHRVGRTGRGDGKIGSALLVLHPSETDFVDELKNAKIPIEEYEIPWNKIKDDFQVGIENLIDRDKHLQKLAKSAFHKYMQAYRMKGRKFFDGTKLDFEDLVRSFGFRQPLVNFKSLFTCTFKY